MSSSRRWVLALLALLGLAAAAPVVAYAQPGLLGDDEARIVLTGSMEPAIRPGDVVLLDTDVGIHDVQVGDVVTFRAHADAEKTLTHRIVEVKENTGGTVLVTKGDANEDPDPMNVDDAMLVGRVDHQLPVYGKLVTAIQDLPLAPGLVALSAVTVVNEIRGLRSRDEGKTAFDPVDPPEAEPEPPTGTRFEVVR